MQSQRVDFGKLLISPHAHLAAGLILAVGLVLLPDRHAQLVKSKATDLLRPGQRTALALREHGGRLVACARVHFQTADQLLQTERRLAQAEKENQRLAAELARAAAAGVENAGVRYASSGQPLLRATCVPARVLGCQARAFLVRRHLLDVGGRSGVEPDALVVNVPPGWVDQGSDADLEPGQLVVAGSCVWGKIVQVGKHTSAVRNVAEPGYRDLVRLAGPAAGDGHIRWGPQGILEGTGEKLARIRLIEVTEPVSVGDLVYTAAGDGVLPEPLRYGSVTRVERAAGAAHWQIWMEPAADPRPPKTVAVVRVKWNPLRVAKSP